MLGFSFFRSSKPGSVFLSPPPFMSAAVSRKKAPCEVVMSGEAILPLYFGSHIAIHEVGFSFTASLLYTRACATYMNLVRDRLSCGTAGRASRCWQFCLLRAGSRALPHLPAPHRPRPS